MKTSVKCSCGRIMEGKTIKEKVTHQLMHSMLFAGYREISSKDHKLIIEKK